MPSHNAQFPLNIETDTHTNARKRIATQLLRGKTRKQTARNGIHNCIGQARRGNRLLTPGTLFVAAAATPRTAAPDRYSGRRPPRGIARTSRIAYVCTRARARHHPIHFLVLLLLLYDPLTKESRTADDNGRTPGGEAERLRIRTVQVSVYCAKPDGCSSQTASERVTQRREKSNGRESVEIRANVPLKKKPETTLPFFGFAAKLACMAVMQYQGGAAARPSAETNRRCLSRLQRAAPLLACFFWLYRVGGYCTDGGIGQY